MWRLPSVVSVNGSKATVSPRDAEHINALNCTIDCAGLIISLAFPPHAVAPQPIGVRGTMPKNKNYSNVPHRALVQLFKRAGNA
jgi:hypothetical protein